jgi:hypothetical protein
MRTLWSTARLRRRVCIFAEPPREAAAGESNRPFILVIEGSIPNERNKAEGLLGFVWHGFHNRSAERDLRMG